MSAAEVLYLPFALFSRTRAVAWLSMVLRHCGILFFIAFAELSLGMLLVHLFVFDSHWLSGWKRWRQRFVVPATAVGRKR